MDNKELVPTNELMASVVATRCREDATFAKQVEDAPDKILKIDIADVAVHTVQNTGDTVHVPLPDYSCMPVIAQKINDELSDEDLKKISGGEFIISGLIILGVTVGSVTAGIVAAAGIGVVIAAAVGAFSKNIEEGSSTVGSSIVAGDNSI